MSNSLQPFGLQPTRILHPWGFSRQEYWSGFPCPPLAGRLKPGIEPESPMSPALAGGFFTTSATWHLKVAKRQPGCVHSLANASQFS